MALPFTEERRDLTASDLRRKKKIGLERQKDGRSFRTLREGQDGGAHLPCCSQDQKDILRVLERTWRTVTEKDFVGRGGDGDRDLVGAGNCVLAQTSLRHGSYCRREEGKKKG